MIGGMSSAQFANQLISSERQGRDKLNRDNMGKLKNQQNAYKALEKSLDKINDSLSGFDKDKFKANLATTSDEKITTVSVGMKAPQGNFHIHTSQLASGFQASKSYLSENSLIGKDSTISLSFGDKHYDIHVKADNTVASLRDAINEHADKSGFHASLIRTGNQVQMLISADKQGKTVNQSSANFQEQQLFDNLTNPKILDVMKSSEDNKKKDGIKAAIIIKYLQSQNDTQINTSVSKKKLENLDLNNIEKSKDILSSLNLDKNSKNYKDAETKAANIIKHLNTLIAVNSDKENSNDINNISDINDIKNNKNTKVDKKVQDAVNYFLKSDQDSLNLLNQFKNKNSAIPTLVSITENGKQWADKTTNGQNAIIILNGHENTNGKINDGIKIESPTNELNDVIDGVNLNLIKKGDINLNIKSDLDKSKQTVKGFVDSVNTLLNSINGLTRSMGTKSLKTDHTSSNKKGEKKTETSAVSQKQIGILKGDSSVRILQDKIRNIVFFKTPNGLGLSDIGVSITRSGTLEINDKKLEEAVRTKSDKIIEMFNGKKHGTFSHSNLTSESKKSPANSLISYIEKYVKPYTDFSGFLDQKDQSLNRQIHRLEDDMSNFDQQMKQKYDMYLAQFSAMEATINDLNSVSSLFN